MRNCSAIANGMMTMPKRLAAAVALIAACLANLAQAQQHLPAPRPIEAVPAAEALHPALWKVADADTTIYLFGTIHLLPPGIEWFDGALANAVESADELVTEIPELADGTVQSSLLDRAVLPKSKSLRGLLTKQERAKFEAAMRRYQLPIDSFDRFKPWYAAVVLATLPLLRDGFAVADGVESTLAERVKARGKPRVGLETLDYQLALFDSLPLATQRRYLSEVIDALPTLRQDVAKMVAQWAKGETDKLAALMNAAADDPAMVATLLTNRNRQWASWIKARLARPGTSFVAVGAGHLGGTGSLQDQLKRLGITTTRIQ